MYTVHLVKSGSKKIPDWVALALKTHGLKHCNFVAYNHYFLMEIVLGVCFGNKSGITGFDSNLDKSIENSFQAA